MARIRMITPGFFDDPDIADLSIMARLFFVGLWTQADREGRLVDDMRRLKARLFPFDAVDVDALAVELHRKDMIRRYTDGAGHSLIWVRCFAKHQRPHHKETASVLAACLLNEGRYPGKVGASPGKVSLNPPESGVLILDSGVRSLVDGGSPSSALRARFDRFWDAYPKKVGKDAAWGAFQKRSPGDDLTDEMITAVTAQRASEQWRKEGGQYIPNPRTWIHQGRWQDESGVQARPTVDWAAECLELHGGTCTKRWDHGMRMKDGAA